MINRAKLFNELTTLERRLLTPDGGDPAPALTPRPAQVPTLLMPCWQCWQRVPECSKPDCTRRDQVRKCPEMVTEGRASRHEVGGRK